MDSAKLCLDCDVFVLNNLNFFQDAYLYGEIFDFVAVGCLNPMGTPNFIMDAHNVKSSN